VHATFLHVGRPVEDAGVELAQRLGALRPDHDAVEVELCHARPPFPFAYLWSYPATVRQCCLFSSGALAEYASNVLAYCDMRTLYLRNVPDEVVARLERLAATEGASVNADAVRELAEASRRADNPALLGALPDLGVDV